MTRENPIEKTPSPGFISTFPTEQQQVDEHAMPLVLSTIFPKADEPCGLEAVTEVRSREMQKRPNALQ